VVRVDQSQQQSTDLVNVFYEKLGEAVGLAEELQRVAQSKQELRQARKIAKQLTNLRGNASELLYDTENRQT
jgi:predicted RNA-binding Zn ribbon-like protein